MGGSSCGNTVCTSFCARPRADTSCQCRRRASLITRVPRCERSSSGTSKFFVDLWRIGDASKHEEMQPSPLSPYALHKLIAEQYASLYTRLYGLETVSLRFFNVFGPRQSPGSQYSGVISLFTAALLEDRSPTIYGDGEQTRDFTYVSDVVDGILRALSTPGVSGQAINLARGDRTSVNSLYAMLQRATGVERDALYEELRTGDIRDSQADISRARKLLGFEPGVTVEEGLRRTVEWQRTNGVTTHLTRRFLMALTVRLHLEWFEYAKPFPLHRLPRQSRLARPSQYSLRRARVRCRYGCSQKG